MQLQKQHKVEGPARDQPQEPHKPPSQERHLGITGDPKGIISTEKDNVLLAASSCHHRSSAETPNFIPLTHMENPFAVLCFFAFLDNVMKHESLSLTHLLTIIILVDYTSVRVLNTTTSQSVNILESALYYVSAYARA